MKLYLVTLEKVKRSRSRKAQFKELQRLAKENIRSMHGQQHQEQKKKTYFELFTYNMDTNAYLENLKKILRIWRKCATKYKF